jgi:hypothetical protein
VKVRGAGLPTALILLAGTVLLAAGCGGGKHFRPVVVAHPQVVGSGVPNPANGEAMFLAPSRVVFNTTATTNCAWWPTRLTITDSSTIRIDMRVNGIVARCGSGGTSFPIAVTIPRIIDVHHSLKIQLAYKVRMPGTGHVKQYERDYVAPALSG